MRKTKIEWCDFSWNPVTGCYYNCEYCYARRIAERFKNVANSISDKEIKLLIMGELQNQIREQVNLGCRLDDIVYEWFEQNTEFVENCIRNCIKEKFSK